MEEEGVVSDPRVFPDPQEGAEEDEGPAAPGAVGGGPALREKGREEVSE